MTCEATFIESLSFLCCSGFAGAAVGVDSWCEQQLTGNALDAIKPYPNEDALITHLKSRLAAVKAKTDKTPSAIIVGALGRCGSGATSLLEKVGVAGITKWDMKETAGGGPFPTLMQSDIFINCIYLSSPIPHFLTLPMLEAASRALSVLVDGMSRMFHFHGDVLFVYLFASHPSAARKCMSKQLCTTFCSELRH